MGDLIDRRGTRASKIPKQMCCSYNAPWY